MWEGKKNMNDCIQVHWALFKVISHQQFIFKLRIQKAVYWFQTGNVQSNGLDVGFTCHPKVSPELYKMSAYLVLKCKNIPLQIQTLHIEYCWMGV